MRWGNNGGKDQGPTPVFPVRTGMKGENRRCQDETDCLIPCQGLPQTPVLIRTPPQRSRVRTTKNTLEPCSSKVATVLQHPIPAVGLRSRTPVITQTCWTGPLRLTRLPTCWKSP